MANDITKELKEAAIKAASWGQTPWGKLTYEEAYNTMHNCPAVNGECDVCPYAYICPKSWM